MPNKEQLFDLRIVGLSIKDNKITNKEYTNFIKKLPDVEDKSEVLTIEEDVADGELIEEAEVQEEDSEETE